MAYSSKVKKATTITNPKFQVPQRDSRVVTGTHNAALKMSFLQTSFAEKTADEMKEIVDWYKGDEGSDQYTHIRISQRKSLPQNLLACLDDEDEDNYGNDKEQSDGECKIAEDEDVQSPSNSRSSSKVAQTQNAKVEDVCAATQEMAAIVHSYKYFSSVESKERSSRRRPSTTIRKRKQKRASQPPPPPPPRIEGAPALPRTSSQSTGTTMEMRQFSETFSNAAATTSNRQRMFWLGEMELLSSLVLSFSLLFLWVSSL